eukprot:6194208-Pleurochrysis_carterae.AAC.1
MENKMTAKQKKLRSWSFKSYTSANGRLVAVRAGTDSGHLFKIARPVPRATIDFCASLSFKNGVAAHIKVISGPPAPGGLAYAPFGRLGQGVGPEAHPSCLSSVTWVYHAWLMPRVAVFRPLGGRRGSGADATSTPARGVSPRSPTGPPPTSAR